MGEDGPLAAALDALDVESRAVAELRERARGGLRQALELLAGTSGRVIVSGLGKSGHIGAKIAATLASTGTPAQFVHAAEALHGDAGMVTAEDVAILISSSGSTAEVVQFGRMIREQGVAVIAMTGDAGSPLARLAQVWLDIGVEREADPLGLAPTTSTTVTLALGDALAAGLMAASGFTHADFHVRHPGGALGARLAGEA